MANILITGHRGYIGSNVAALLAGTGHTVYGYDMRLFGGQDNDSSLYVNEVESVHHVPAPIDIVIHLGARISVEESTRYPSLYWKDNVEATLETLRAHPNAHVIFASTSQVGIGDNPYTRTKEAMEMAIKDVAKSYHIFRFYNVAGAFQFGQIGPSTHLIRIAAECAAGRRDGMFIFGTDYDTHDGTCVRDFLHVEDLANALVKACDYPGVYETIHLGNGEGYSVRQVVETMKTIALEYDGVNPDFLTSYAHRRAGDPPSLVCVPNDLRDKYYTQTRDLADMCRSALEWEL